MVSSVLLALIHSRLDEIFPNTGKSFGNMNIVLFGDLLQVKQLNFLNILKIFILYFNKRYHL